MFKRHKVFIFATVATCTLYIMLYLPHSSNELLTLDDYGNVSNEFENSSNLLYTKGCKIPQYDIFDPTIMKYYKKVSGGISCKGPQYLSIANNKVILNTDAVKKDFNDKNFSCTYSAIIRNPKNETSRADNKFEYSAEKTLIFNESFPDEFGKAFCRIESDVVYEEFLASTPIKAEVEKKCNKNSIKILDLNHLNVIVIGIDSISKLNFERHFKRTAKYLRQNLSTFEFHGYMKVADNTFPNLTPLLTGHFVTHYYTRNNTKRYFDNLDFIWKNFSSIGYRTFFAEDAPRIGTYNYVKNGFQFPPTDYFFRPFTLAIEGSLWQEASKDDCFQAKPEIVALYDYLRSFLTTMGNRPYFAFTWATRLTHDKLNKAGYADKPTYKLLKDIKDMGLLNKSVLIFLSDHGIRFGDIRRTFIGKIEERMPFLFISFPKWFLQAHVEINMNLLVNQKRLTTPFDLHEMLVDIYQLTSGDYSYIRTPYGISLFQKISTSRDCKSAYILPHWCVCHEYRKLRNSSKLSIKAANVLIHALNDITAPHRTLCRALALDEILDAIISVPEKNLLRYKKLKRGDFEDTITFDSNFNSQNLLMITIRTAPGKAEFEASMKKINNDFVVTEISRINAYGKHGNCIDNASLRKYCYCKIN